MRFLICFVCLLALPLLAQTIDGPDPVPPAPEGRILDDARLFALAPERLERISRRLSELSERTGYEIYVAIFNTLISDNLGDRAGVLQEAWIGDRPGVLLVIENDSARYELGWSRTPDVVTESGEKVPVLAAGDLPPQEQVRILNRLSAIEQGVGGSMAAAENLIGTFADEIDQSFVASERAVPARWNVRVLMLGTGLLAGMLLLALLVGAWIRRSDVKVSERLVFPKVTVGMRLGAPCGGGKLSSRSFDVLPRGKA